MEENGGSEARLIDEGDCGICSIGQSIPAESVYEREMPTGVRSLSESASVADVAASIRSSHLLPFAAATAAPGGSAEKAFLPSILILRVWSFDFVLSCFGFLAFCVIEDFRGRACLSLLIDSFLCKGGRVEERTDVGECGSIDGRSSRGLGEWNCGMDC